MPTQVALPQLGESVDSGVIIEWLVAVGDDIELDQPIAEISTDKVDTEIPSPTAGTVTALLVEVDTEVAVGQPILELAGGDDGAGGEVAAGGTATPTVAPAPATPASGPRDRPNADDPEAPATAVQATDTRPVGSAAVGPLSPKVKRLLREHDLDPANVTGHGPGGRITPDDVTDATRGRAGWSAAGVLSPKVKRLLRDHGVDPRTVEGTGEAGRITPDDVHQAASAQRPGDQTPADAPAERQATPEARPAAATPVAPLSPGSRVEKLTRTRSVIAERMLESLQTTAQLTAAVEADVTRVMSSRARAKDAYRARYGASLSPLAFITRATVRTLLRHPLLNASIDTDAGTVTYHGSVHLGLAVDTPQGLFVPNIRDAQDLTVAGLQRRITDLGTRARDRKLTADEIRGGTFTISNTGSRGSLFDTPILNPPEVGILATPTIEKRPVVVADEVGDRIAIRHRTYLCLTYDHRLVDGADAARFLSDLAADLDGTDWDQEVAELLG